MTFGQNMEARTNFEGHSPLEWANFWPSCLLSFKIACHLMAEQAREQCLCLICVFLKVLRDVSKKKVNSNLFWVQKRKILGENQGASSLSCNIMPCLCKHTKRWDPPSVVAVLLLWIRLSAGQFVIKGKRKGQHSCWTDVKIQLSACVKEFNWRLTPVLYSVTEKKILLLQF